MTKLIYSMSHPWKVVEKKLLDDKCLQFAEHLAKIIQCPEDREVNHWSNELYALCGWINKITIKPNNKRISVKQMDDYYFGSCNDPVSFSSWCRTVRNKFHIKEDNSKDLENFNNKALPFIKELEQELYSKQEFTLEDMKSLIKQYLL